MARSVSRAEDLFVSWLGFALQEQATEVRLQVLKLRYVVYLLDCPRVGRYL